METRQVRVDESNYRSNHGAAPRGRGSWAFCAVHPDQLDYLQHVLWVHGQTYAAARKAAVSQAKARGLKTLWVCS